MLVYWVAFLFPVSFCFFRSRLSIQEEKLFVGLIWVFFFLLIGLRFEVGGDWDSYLRHLSYNHDRDFLGVLTSGDPGYYLINYFVAKAGGGIAWVNSVCAAIIMTGVVRFSRSQPLPWLAIVVSVPYLIIVVAMGYTRQSAALGFLLLGLVSLSNKNSLWFVFWVVLGSTFHKSAVLMLPMAALASTQRRLWNFFWIGVASFIFAYIFVFDSAGDLWSNYVEADYESQGGLVRVLMNVVPAVLFLCFKRKLAVSEAERRLWTWMSLAALLCLPLVVISSTATDRVALYLIPLQLYVFARLHLIFSDSYARAVTVISVIFYYALVQFVWLLFAANADDWLPYQMYPFAS